MLGMSEPASTVATAAATSFGAMVLAAIGVEPQALVWALVGAVFGVAWAPPAGRLRSMMVFIAVVLVCALGGTLASDMWHVGGHTARNLWSAGLAAIFHPLLAAFIQAIPTLLQAFIRAKGGGEPPQQGGQP